MWYCAKHRRCDVLSIVQSWGGAENALYDLGIIAVGRIDRARRYIRGMSIWQRIITTGVILTVWSGRIERGGFRQYFLDGLQPQSEGGILRLEGLYLFYFLQ